MVKLEKKIDGKLIGSEIKENYDQQFGKVKEIIENCTILSFQYNEDE